jgi:hypothetical protein
MRHANCTQKMQMSYKKGNAMKDIKELWIEYQREKELQVVEIPITNHNEERLRELENAIFSRKRFEETLSMPTSSTDKIRA